MERKGKKGNRQTKTTGKKTADKLPPCTMKLAACYTSFSSVYTCIQTDRDRDRQTDRQIDRHSQTDTQTDKQSNRHTETDKDGNLKLEPLAIFASGSSNRLKLYCGRHWSMLWSRSQYHPILITITPPCTIHTLTHCSCSCSSCATTTTKTTTSEAVLRQALVNTVVEITVPPYVDHYQATLYNTHTDTLQQQQQQYQLASGGILSQLSGYSTSSMSSQHKLGQKEEFGECKHVFFHG